MKFLPQHKPIKITEYFVLLFFYTKITLIFLLKYLGIETHLFVKVRRLGDSERTF